VSLPTSTMTPNVAHPAAGQQRREAALLNGPLDGLVRHASRSLADTNTSWLHDPESVGRWLVADQRESAFQNRERVLDALSLRPQNPDATVTRGRVLFDIGEVEIESNQNPIFVQTNIKDRCVRVTSEALFVDGLGVGGRRSEITPAPHAVDSRQL
jgi:hypothetical protein